MVSTFRTVYSARLQENDGLLMLLRLKPDDAEAYVNWLEKLRGSSIKSRYRVCCSWSVSGFLKTRVRAVTVLSTVDDLNSYDTAVGCCVNAVSGCNRVELRLSHDTCTSL